MNTTHIEGTAYREGCVMCGSGLGREFEDGNRHAVVCEGCTPAWQISCTGDDCTREAEQVGGFCPHCQAEIDAADACEGCGAPPSMACVCWPVAVSK